MQNTKGLRVPHQLAKVPIVQGVLEGTYTVRFGSQEHMVRKNEMVLLQKSIMVEYEKSGEEGSGQALDYMMFFLKQELLTEFIKMADLESIYPSALVPVSVQAVNERLLTYIYSLKPHFKETDAPVKDGWIKVKLLVLRGVQGAVRVGPVSVQATSFPAY